MNHSPENTLHDCFEKIYASDLTFQPGCWELCGDAHCCHFSRYKANFSLIEMPRADALPPAENWSS